MRLQLDKILKILEYITKGEEEKMGKDNNNAGMHLKQWSHYGQYDDLEYYDKLYEDNDVQKLKHNGSEKQFKAKMKAVKVIFNTSDKEFTRIMSQFYLALTEMDIQRMNMNRNIRAGKAWLKTLSKSNINERNSEKIVAQKIEIEKMEKEMSELVKQISNRIDECYKLIQPELYEAYINNRKVYASKVEKFFLSQKIEPTPSLVKYMVKNVEMNIFSTKEMLHNGKMSEYKSEKEFYMSFMSGLAVLMYNKNALKLEKYK